MQNILIKKDIRKFFNLFLLPKMLLLMIQMFPCEYIYQIIIIQSLSDPIFIKYAFYTTSLKISYNFIIDSK